MSSCPYDEVYVCHDSENCWLPTNLEVRDNQGNLVRTPQVLFSKIASKANGVTIVKEIIRSGLACKMGLEAAAEVDIYSSFDSLTYYFVCKHSNNKVGAEYQPPPQTIKQFDHVTGASVITCDTKPGAVDLKIKSLINTKLEDVKMKTKEQREKMLFVLVSGDSDFSAEINSVRKAKIDIAVIWSKDVGLNSSIPELLKSRQWASPSWLNIVAEARFKEGHPFYHALAPDPRIAQGVRLPVTRVPLPVTGVPLPVHHFFFISDLMKASYIIYFMRYTLGNKAKTFHSSLLVTLCDRKGLTRTEKGYKCCELSFSGTVRPPQRAIEDAINAVNFELDMIVVDSPVTVPGEPLQLKNDESLTKLANDQRVYYFLPELGNVAPSADVGGVGVGVSSRAIELLPAAEALHSYIVNNTTKRKLAAASMNDFYNSASSSSVYKSAIQLFNMSCFCEINCLLLRWEMDAKAPGKGWICALPTPPNEVWQLFKFIVEVGTTSPTSPRQRSIAAAKLGDFYGPNGRHPALKEKITAGGIKIKAFVEMNTVFTWENSTKEDGYGRIFAKYEVPEPSLPPQSPSKLGKPQAQSEKSTSIILAYDGRMTEGRDRVLQLLMPQVTKSLFEIPNAAMLGMCQTVALPTLRSIAWSHEVKLHKAPTGFLLEGTPDRVSRAKDAIQQRMDTIEIRDLAVPKNEFDVKKGFEGLKSAVRNASTADDSSANCKIYAHIVNPKAALVLFLPAPFLSTEDAKEERENFDEIRSALDNIITTYHEVYCHKRHIRTEVNYNLVEKRFSLYKANFIDPGILLCGPKDSVAEAMAWLTTKPLKDRTEKREYKAVNIRVAILLKNKLHASQLISIKQAAYTFLSAAMKVKIDLCNGAFNSKALFTIEGRAEAVDEAFQRANEKEAAWAATLIEKPLLDGVISEFHMQYLQEENNSLLGNLSKKGVFLMKASRKPKNETPFERQITAHLGAVELRVLLGDLLRISCDAIVNPANGQLNNAGGIARVIAEAAGSELELECQQLKSVLPNGSVSIGTSVCTKAYKLAELNGYAKLVIHSVGPRYTTGSTSECDSYRRCVMSALDLAVNNDRATIEYIAFTLMGVGIYGWPRLVAAKLMVQAISEWVSRGGAKSLKRIMIVDVNEDCTAAMVEAVLAFNDSIPSLLDDMAVAVAVPAPPAPRPKFQWYWECIPSDKECYSSPDSRIIMGSKWFPYDYDQVTQIESALENGLMPVTLRGDISKVSNNAVYQITLEDYITLYGKEPIAFTQMRLDAGGVKKNFKRAVRLELFVQGMHMPGYSVEAPLDAPLADAAILIAPRNFETVEIVRNSKSLYSLYGPPKDIDAANTWLQQALDKVVPPTPVVIMSEQEQIQWPSEWTNGPFKVTDPVQIVPVQPLTDEWQQVEEEWRGRATSPFLSRDPNALRFPEKFTLQAVHRVQNSTAWASYYSRVKLMAHSYDVLNAESAEAVDPDASQFTRANEWTMKHGTRGTDPSVIYESDSGIDMRFSDGVNYFGKAAYTAEDAIYSHNYAYKVPGSDNVRQMLLVRIVAGVIHEVPIDGRTKAHQNWVTPPKGFQSVRGPVNAANSMAIMVYQPDHCYPSYLLTYAEQSTA